MRYGEPYLSGYRYNSSKLDGGPHDDVTELSKLMAGESIVYSFDEGTPKVQTKFDENSVVSLTN